MYWGCFKGRKEGRKDGDEEETRRLRELLKDGDRK